MVKKIQKSTAEKKVGAQLSSTVKDSAQQIWLAGLGAFAKAQEEGGKVFDALVKEGLSIQRKTQSVAEEKITEATSKVANMATDIGTKASGQWDKLENIFEDRVAKALHKLGVPSARDVAELKAEVAALRQQVPLAKAAAKPVVKKDAKKAVKADAKKPSAKPIAKPASTPASKPVSAKPAATKPASAKPTADAGNATAAKKAPARKTAAPAA